MNSEQIKSKILLEIRKQKVGASQQKIAEGTGLSRPTVIKYLQLLKEEGKVKKVKVGRFSLWTYSNNNTLELMPAPVFVDFIQYSLKAAQEEYNSIDWKKVGIKMAQYIDSQDFIKTEVLRPKIASIAKSASNLHNLLQDGSFIFGEILNSFCNIFHLGTLQPPIIVESPPVFIFRIDLSRELESASIFEIICGLIQGKLSQIIPQIKFQISSQFHQSPLVPGSSKLAYSEEERENKKKKEDSISQLVDVTVNFQQNA